MFACIGIARGAGLSTQFAWYQMCLVKPAPTMPLTVQLRCNRTQYNYQLSTINYQLSTINYQLSTVKVHCQLK